MTRRDQTVELYQKGLAVAEIARQMGFSETTTRIYLKKSGIKPENRVLDHFLNEFLAKAKAVHGERYQYDRESYQGAGKKMRVTCSVHGVFEITPQGHLRGAGCPACKRFTKEEFLEKVKKDGYEYPELPNFLKKIELVKVMCHEHGEFYQQVHNRVRGSRCPKCANRVGRCQLEIGRIFQEAGLEVVFNDRSALGDYEIDVYIPSLKFGVEYHGIYWHSALFRSKTFHQDKWRKATQVGIKLVQIFEDEWLLKRDLVTAMLQHRIGKSERIWARKCRVAILSKDLGRSFFEENHVQGKDMALVYYGLWHQEKLVACASFYRPQLSGGDRSVEWLISRFATARVAVAGGFSRLLARFISDFKPWSIGTYADLRWGDGEVYLKNGFEFSHTTRPSYFYIREKDAKRVHRFAYRKSELKKLVPGVDGTEEQLAELAGLLRIYDAGNTYYRMDLSDPPEP